MASLKRIWFRAGKASQEQLQKCCQQQNEGRGVLDEVEYCSQYNSDCNTQYTHSVISLVVPVRILVARGR